MPALSAPVAGSERPAAVAAPLPAEWAEHGWSLGPAEVAGLVASVLSASVLLNLLLG